MNVMWKWVCVVGMVLLLPMQEAAAGQSVSATGNGISVDSDGASYLMCSGGIVCVFGGGEFAVISRDEVTVPVCIDTRGGSLHNLAGGNQAADCRRDVIDDPGICAGPVNCAGEVDLSDCW